MLFVLTISIAMKAYFRALAAACKSPAAAQTLGGLSVLAMALYTGQPFLFMAQLCADVLICRLYDPEAHNYRSIALDNVHQRELCSI